MAKFDDPLKRGPKSGQQTEIEGLKFQMKYHIMDKNTVIITDNKG